MTELTSTTEGERRTSFADTSVVDTCEESGDVAPRPSVDDFSPSSPAHTQLRNSPAAQITPQHVRQQQEEDERLTNAQQEERAESSPPSSVASITVGVCSESEDSEENDERSGAFYRRILIGRILNREEVFENQTHCTNTLRHAFLSAVQEIHPDCNRYRRRTSRNDAWAAIEILKELVNEAALKANIDPPSAEMPALTPRRQHLPPRGEDARRILSNESHVNEAAGDVAA